MRDFVDQVYVPDTLAIAGFYKDWFARGEGLGNFMTYGDFPADGRANSGSLLIPSGVILGRDLSRISSRSISTIRQQIQEFAAHSWYDYSAGKTAGPASLCRRNHARLQWSETAFRAARSGANPIPGSSRRAGVARLSRSAHWRAC